MKMKNEETMNVKLVTRQQKRTYLPPLLSMYYLDPTWLY